MFQKDQGVYWVIKAGVEKHAKTNKETQITLSYFAYVFSFH